MCPCIYNLLTNSSDNQFLPKRMIIIIGKIFIFFKNTLYSYKLQLDTLNVLVLSLLSAHLARTMRPPDHMWPGTRA